MVFPRESGILLHPTSLPGPHGIGDFGDSAFRFIDWLERGGQRLWQVMPLGPTGFGDSPYSSPSAFAGNPLLISLAWLQGDGLLEEQELTPAREFPEHAVDFPRVVPFRMRMLRAAFDRFRRGAASHLRAEFETFVQEGAVWLDDFAMFMAIKEAVGGGWWPEWPEDIRRRTPEAMAAWRERVADDVRFHKFVQFLFQRQWQQLRHYANERGIRIIGDIPIFVAYDSADVWAHQDLFQLGADGYPTFVAGVPPDPFSATGQLWGNPVYDWPAMRAGGFAWWTERIAWTRHMVDIVRVDHFRGFAAAWLVPFGAPDASGGHWEIAPGGEVFAAARRALGDFPVIVEDLGVITPDVISLRELLGFPGMNVLQFAFEEDPHNVYLPHNARRNSVAYTATHDNQTTVGWFHSRPDHEREAVQRYLGRDGSDIAWDLIRAAWASVANTAIAPMQDVLRLGDEARMNTPGTQFGNWSWRLLPEQLDASLADGLRELTHAYGRIPDGDGRKARNPYDYTDPASGVHAERPPSVR
ncbi:MAG TPA: 4-alpha-glucanotransferase [Thermomicrobiales bacterium]|nr:4-alpha-glucanotransferase [Thermomicrobiales bacterium]